MFQHRRYIDTYFSTYTILNWQHLLNSDTNKNIIINSLKYLVENKRIVLYSFVIMPNHIHLIWEICEGNRLQDVQRDFLKFTSQHFLYDLRKNSALLDNYISTTKDRKHQIWERRGLSVLIYNQKVLEQKLKYIHNNPLQNKWKLARNANDYHYSSANFYFTGNDNWGFLKHYAG